MDAKHLSVWKSYREETHFLNSDQDLLFHVKKKKKRSYLVNFIN